MRALGVPYRPKYTGDEVVLGLVVGVLLHLALIGPFVVKAILPQKVEPEEKPLVSRPVVQASLLKLGKPLDPKRLPDRLVPQQRSAPKKTVTASREDPSVKKPDAGAEPPPNTQDSDLTNLIDKSDPFAEDAGKARPEVGHESGVDGGTETDPNKARAGDVYAAQLGQFFAQRLSFPSVVSEAELRKLCVVMQINIGRNMAIWHVQREPVIKSGNEIVDDAARGIMMRLLDDKTPLPTPPKEVDEQYRGRTVQVLIKASPHGDPSRCIR